MEQVKAGVPDAVWVDIAGRLRQSASANLFYRTDHHWTSAGAWEGYAALMDAMGEPFAPLGSPETVSENFNGTLYSTSGVHWLPPDSIQRYIPGDGVTVEDVLGQETHGLYVERFLVVSFIQILPSSAALSVCLRHIRIRMNLNHEHI